MEEHREAPGSKEQKRLEQLRYIMERWNELPETMQCRFEGQVQTVRDFLMQKTN